MKSRQLIAFGAFAALAGSAVPSQAQNQNAPELGEVTVTANRLNARYAQQERPVVGLRRQADSVVMSMAISSDSRDAETRKREIHATLLAAMDKAASSGVELVTGSFELVPVTRANYQELPHVYAGRVDTSKVDLLVKVRLAGSAVAAEKQIADYVKSIPKSGRIAIDKANGLTLTIKNPDQYRDAIVKLVAENARYYASMFGPNYAVNVTGIDGHISWSQISSTDVFLYVPYRYTIVAK